MSMNDITEEIAIALQLCTTLSAGFRGYVPCIVSFSCPVEALLLDFFSCFAHTSFLDMLVAI